MIKICVKRPLSIYLKKPYSTTWTRFSYLSVFTAAEPLDDLEKPCSTTKTRLFRPLSTECNSQYDLIFIFKKSKDILIQRP